ncbi:MAG: signal peptidase I [Desulfuromonadales bacterium]|nr:signal peptidase I [Desulfuromonadales bacterium]
MLALALLGGGLLIILLIIASFWKVFVKAGQPGWKSLIPIYNLFVLLQIAGCPSWWLLMFFLPVVNIYFMVVMHIRLAEKFGKPPLFGFALCFLGFIFFPILAFGPAIYEGEESFAFDEG